MHRTILLAALLLTGCTGEVDDLIGLLEPVRVHDGTFHEGELPLANAPMGTLTVTGVEARSGLAVVGQLDRGLTGRVTEDAWALAVRIGGMGSGWWVVPVENLNPIFPGQRDFHVEYDVNGGIPPGIHPLQLAAVNEDGERGPVFDVETCFFEDAVPDGLNACDPTLPPPAIVVSLVWDRLVDLDLRMKTPDGQEITWKAPTTGVPDASGKVPGEALEDPTLGRLTRDSNAGCVIDGRNAEAVVWREPPTAGSYPVYVDFFEPCGERGTNFVVSVYRRRELDGGRWALEETERRAGSLELVHVTGGGRCS